MKIVAKELVSSLDLLLPVQEAAGKEVLQDLLQGPNDSGMMCQPKLEFRLCTHQAASSHRLGRTDVSMSDHFP